MIHQFDLTPDYDPPQRPRVNIRGQKDFMAGKRYDLTERNRNV